MRATIDNSAFTKVINIGPREQLKRRVLGIAALASATALTFVLIAYNAPRLSRVVVFVPIWIAGLGLFQAREKTCIALAARGRRNLDVGEEAIDDEKAAAWLLVKSRRIQRKALIIAVLLTLLILAFA